MRGLAARVVVTALAVALGVSAAATPHTASARTPMGHGAPCAAGLDGSFLQLTQAAAERPRAEWEQLFVDMAAAQVTQVFVQWSSADGVAFYAPPSGGRASATPSPAQGTIDLVLELAERHGQRVWLGLAHDAGWWAGIDRSRPATEVEVFLARRRLANLEVARALAPRAARRLAFAGWYVPDEVDDKNWLGDERMKLVADYLTQLAGELRSIVPDAAVAVSGFAQGWATPAQLAAQWSAIVARAPLALVLLQDGVGAGKLGLDELAVYLPPLRAALDASPARLGVVVELFVARPPAPGGGGAFAAVPAPLARVEAQIALARRWTSGPLVAFSMPDYMSDFAGADAAGLYAGYRAWRERCASRR